MNVSLKFQLHSYDYGSRSYLRLFRHERFAFDPAGNRLDGLSGSHTEKTTTLNRVWGNLLKNWLGKHYEYDQRGNLLAKSENGKQETFRWNSYNRLIQYTKDNQTTEYKYDPFGRRIAKIHNGTTTLYHWDGDVLAAESNANSTTHYIFEPDTFEPVAQFVSAPLRPQTPLTFRDYTYYTPEIDPLNQEPTPQEYLPDSLAYFHLDHLGTPIEMTDRTGKTVWEASYQAWGEVEMVSGSLKQPFRFQGQYFDEESGLHYNRFRYYDPSSGRFVSQDPIGLLGGGNLYAYVDNPNQWVDNLGLDHRKVFWDTVGNGNREKYQVHHIFPQEFFNNSEGRNAKVSQILKCHNIEQDSIHNWIGLPRNVSDNPRKNENWFGTSQHNSNHHAYSKVLREIIEKIGSSGSCREQKLKLLALQRGARSMLKQGVPLMKREQSTQANWESVLKAFY